LSFKIQETVSPLEITVLAGEHVPKSEDGPGLAPPPELDETPGLTVLEEEDTEGLDPGVAEEEEDLITIEPPSSEEEDVAD
jgi:hypothetical protein